MVIEAKDLRKTYYIRRHLFGRGVDVVRAVDGVSFGIPASKTLGLVGESGSGKTTVGKILLGVVMPDSGDVSVNANSIYRNGRVDRSILSRCNCIFQDPFASLDPKMSVEEIIAEGMIIRGKGAAERARRVREVLDLVRLPERARSRYPHEFSGGQRQRIAIARAIATDPGFIVCDEPVSSLDVSIQAQILNLLKDIQAMLGLAYLFISHDLSVVEYMADEVAVMYQGRIVESGPTAALYASPRHPYTQRLIDSILEPVPG